jgi:hypothetical protein
MMNRIVVSVRSLRWLLVAAVVVTVATSVQVVGARSEEGCCGNSSCSTLNDDPLIPCNPGPAGNAFCAGEPDGDQFPKCCDVGGCPA